MNTYRRSRTRTGFRAAAGVGIAITLALVSAGNSSADTQVPLPDGHDQTTSRDGVTVYVDRTGEHATISGSMASSPTSRNVWVSGVTTATVAPAPGVRVTGGTIETGYLLGCQVDISSGLSTGTGEAGSYFNMPSSAPTPSIDPNVSLSLAPGKVVKAKVNTYDFDGLSGTTQYVDSTLAIEGCAGYAQARSYTNVTTHTNVMDDTITLWGAPFSIG